MITKFNPPSEFFIDEGAHIIEMDSGEAECSIARARVKPGVTTQWHSLTDTIERYVMLEGTGRVEIGNEPPTDVHPMDTVTIPAGMRQRITNTGTSDLIFLCICTPRFQFENYVNLES